MEHRRPLNCDYHRASSTVICQRLKDGQLAVSLCEGSSLLIVLTAHIFLSPLLLCLKQKLHTKCNIVIKNNENDAVYNSMYATLVAIGLVQLAGKSRPRV